MSGRSVPSVVGNAKPLQTASEGSRAEPPPPQIPDTTELESRLKDNNWRSDEAVSDTMTRWIAERLEAASTLSQQQGEIERLRALVYVPGLRRCAKCGLRLISSTLNANSGRVAANNEPQQCPNECGPMWPVTERDAGNELCDTADKMADEKNALQAKVTELEGVLGDVLSVLDHPEFQKLWRRCGKLLPSYAGPRFDVGRIRLALTERPST